MARKIIDLETQDWVCHEHNYTGWWGDSCPECNPNRCVKQTSLDVQIGGDHYKSCSIQPVQFIEANHLEFLEGCVVKRVTRHNKPTGKGKQDIEKAIHELQLLLELRYGDQVETSGLDR